MPDDDLERHPMDRRPDCGLATGQPAGGHCSRYRERAVCWRSRWKGARSPARRRTYNSYSACSSAGDVHEGLRVESPAWERPHTYIHVGARASGSRRCAPSEPVRDLSGPAAEHVKLRDPVLPGEVLHRPPKGVALGRARGAGHAWLAFHGLAAARGIDVRPKPTGRNASDEVPPARTARSAALCSASSARLSWHARATRSGAARLVDCGEPELAARLASDPATRRACMRAGERCVAVPAGKEAAFRRGVRRLGYVLPAPS